MKDLDFSPHFSPEGEMITQRFGFKKDFTMMYCRRVGFAHRDSNGGQSPHYLLCGFKVQVRARPSGEKCGLVRTIAYGNKKQCNTDPFSRKAAGIAKENE